MKKAMFRIEQANEKDLKALTKMGKMLFLEMKDIDPFIKFKKGFEKEISREFSRIIKRKDFLFLKAVSDGKIVGFLFCEIRKDLPLFTQKFFGRIEDIYILPKYRRGGICSALISESIKWFKQNKIKEVTVGVRPKNMPAIKAYEKSRFKEYRMHMRKMI